MIKTLDRYLIRHFLINWVILFCVMMTLFIVVDFLVNIDEFLLAGRERGERMGGAWFGTLYTLVDFYVPVVFLLYVFFSALLVVGATGFTLAGFSRTRELIGMLSSGVSMYRIAAPLVITGFALNLLVVPNQELIIPEFAQKLARKKSEVGLDSIRTFVLRFAPDSQGNLFSAREFDASTNMLADVTVLDRSETRHTIRRIRATQAFWVPPGQTGEFGNAGPGWDLVGGDVISRAVDVTAALDIDQEVQPIQFITSDLSPTLLVARRARHFPRFLSIMELRQLISNEGVQQDARQVRQLNRIVQSRVSMFVFAILLQLVSLPFFLRREPSVNLMLKGIQASGIVIAAWATGIILSETSGTLLNPTTAAWLPVVIALPLAAYMLSEVKT